MLQKKMEPETIAHLQWKEHTLAKAYPALLKRPNSEPSSHGHHPVLLLRYIYVHCIKQGGCIWTGLWADSSICRMTHSQLPDSFTSAWQRRTSSDWQPQSLHPGCPTGARPPHTASTHTVLLKNVQQTGVFSILCCISLYVFMYVRSMQSARKACARSKLCRLTLTTDLSIQLRKFHFQSSE